PISSALQRIDDAKLNKKISVHFDDEEIEKALREVASVAELKLVYRGDIITQKRVSLNYESIEVSSALEIILKDVPLSYKITDQGYLLIFARQQLLSAVPADSVSGVVTDAQSGEVLPGVNIMVKGTTIGTSTDSDGTFEFMVPSLQDTLVFSFVGFQAQEVLIDGRNE